MPDFITISGHRQNVDLWTSRVLRVGVWTSAVLMVSGLLLAAFQPGALGIIRTVTLYQLAGYLVAGHLDPVILMFSGLVVLMTTPVLRVLTAIIGFAMERDRRFVLVSATVFVMLVCEITYSLFVH